MNIEEYEEKFGNLKDKDLIYLEKCDHPECCGLSKPIQNVSLRRNIMKNNGEKFICKDCSMRFNNSFNKVGENRQTNEIIHVICPDCGKDREMKKSGYFGKMEEPYMQTCKSCAQKGRVVSEEQREKISKSLMGREMPEETRKKISETIKNDPEIIARATANLIAGSGAGWNKGMHLSDEVKKKISKANLGKKRTAEQKNKVSVGRKSMLERVGGFTKEHRENISKATIKQYGNGFEPKLHHLHGWHYSEKLGDRIFYRSSYEKKAFMILDEDENVEKYEYEKIKVEYNHPIKNIKSTFLVDILVTNKDGSKWIIEVKPKKLISSIVNKEKIASTFSEAKKLGMNFEVWDEFKLFGTENTEKNMINFKNQLKLSSKQLYDDMVNRLCEEIEIYEKSWKMIDVNISKENDYWYYAWIVWESDKGRFIDMIMLTYADKFKAWACGDSISEMEFPFRFDCPIEFLELTEDNNPYYCKEWREEVMVFWTGEKVLEWRLKDE